MLRNDICSVWQIQSPAETLRELVKQQHLLGIALMSSSLDVPGNRTAVVVAVSRAMVDRLVLKEISSSGGAISR